MFCGAESGYNLSMQASKNDPDLDALPAAIKAAFLAERTARIEAEARADQLQALRGDRLHLGLTFPSMCVGFSFWILWEVMVHVVYR